MNESRETTVILLIIAIVLVGSLIGIGVTVYTITQNSGDLFGTQETSKIPTVFRNPNTGQNPSTPAPEPPKGDYDFLIEEEGGYKLFSGVFDYDFKTFITKDLQPPVDFEPGYFDEGIYADLDKNSLEKDINPNPAYSVLEIPALKIRTPILQEENETEALFRGWWLVPQKFNNIDGEKILLCQRLVFSIEDIKSCYYLNLIEIDDDILVYSPEGNLVRYRVISVDTVSENVETILRPASDNYIKLISNADEKGFPSVGDFRLVVLGERI